MIQGAGVGGQVTGIRLQASGSGDIASARHSGLYPDNLTAFVAKPPSTQSGGSKEAA